MRSRGTDALPARLEAVRQRFEHWRRTRGRRSCIPDPLWAAAVKLCATYGIHRTAKTLRLNPDSLKKHVASTGGNDSTSREARATFVELVPSGPSCAPECMIELEDRRGAKMRIHLSGGQSPEVVTAVSRVFFGVAP